MLVTWICGYCLVLHIFVAGGSDGVEIKHQNVQTEPVEIKDQHVHAEKSYIKGAKCVFVETASVALLLSKHIL